jgi:uncharacterized protein YdeI (YjbR/CyaY-like superfamily)
MTKVAIAEGVVHKLPGDLKEALVADESALERWEDLTPLARNEWICWTVNVKQEATRKDHVRRVVEELLQGVRRPCCWMGCPHRERNGLS